MDIRKLNTARTLLALCITATSTYSTSAKTADDTTKAKKFSIEVLHATSFGKTPKQTSAQYANTAASMGDFLRLQQVRDGESKAQLLESTTEINAAWQLGADELFLSIGGNIAEGKQKSIFPTNETVESGNDIIRNKEKQHIADYALAAAYRLSLARFMERAFLKADITPHYEFIGEYSKQHLNVTATNETSPFTERRSCRRSTQHTFGAGFAVVPKLKSGNNNLEISADFPLRRVYDRLQHSLGGNCESSSAYAHYFEPSATAVFSHFTEENRSFSIAFNYAFLSEDAPPEDCFEETYRVSPYLLRKGNPDATDGRLHLANIGFTHTDSAKSRTIFAKIGSSFLLDGLTQAVFLDENADFRELSLQNIDKTQAWKGEFGWTKKLGRHKAWSIGSISRASIKKGCILLSKEKNAAFNESSSRYTNFFETFLLSHRTGNTNWRAGAEFSYVCAEAKQLSTLHAFDWRISGEVEQELGLGFTLLADAEMAWRNSSSDKAFRGRQLTVALGCEKSFLNETLILSLKTESSWRGSQSAAYALDGIFATSPWGIYPMAGFAFDIAWAF